MTAHPSTTSILKSILGGLLTLLTFSTFAHNGAIAYAYPLTNLKVDGNLADWPKTMVKYPLKVTISDKKPQNETDLSAYFLIAYNVTNRSLYVAVDITDNEYLQDTSKNASWNTQDGLEIYLDARHSPDASGVASYLYTQHFKHINKNQFDAASKNAAWDKIEVAMRRIGTHIFYEWRLPLNEQFQVGKAYGVDMLVFDKDKDDSFTYSAWGKGESKYRNPKSLGDVILMKPGEMMGTVSGKAVWDKPLAEKLPMAIRLNKVDNPGFWIDAQLDSTGKYSAKIPVGNYKLSLATPFMYGEKAIYTTALKTPIQVSVKAGQNAVAAESRITNDQFPDLIPAKGVLHNFDANAAQQVDAFIETCQKYFLIPGVSLALIKDGKVVYHKTYGVQNSFTGTPVNENTLFEAASVTKPVFAYAVQRLMEKGIIDLDKPLYEYLPYPDIAHDERYKLITARHVLTHRTGFPNWRNGKLEIKFTPGTQYNYSGEGFEYLKMVVEKITGKKVEQVLQEEVITPLGLYHTYFSKNDTLQKLAAIGHADNLPTTDELPESPGMAYSMYTEAKAFTQFMLNLLEQKGLKASTYEQMFKMQSEYPNEDGEKPRFKEYMGISLNIRETPYGLAFGHGGNNGDFRCEFELYKDLKMGYVIFTNADSSYPMIEAISDFLVDGKK